LVLVRKQNNIDLGNRSGRATITKLEAQKRNSRRVSVFLDGDFAFGMDARLAIELGLRKGRTLDRAELERIARAEEKSRAKHYSLDFLSYRARSIWEVRDRLARRGHGGEIIDEVIDELRREGLLDDEDFARRWAGDRMKNKPIGERLLRRELRLKRIDGEIIDRVAAAAYRDLSTERVAGELLRARQERYRRLDMRTARRRMVAFLLRRGFERSAAREAVGQVLDEWSADENQAENRPPGR
jgi:regulatory protein